MARPVHGVEDWARSQRVHRRMTEQESEQKKVGLTAVRIPVLILGALAVMLVIGILVIG